MKQRPLAWGMDQLVLRQQVTPTSAAQILYDRPALSERLAASGFPLRRWRAVEGKTKLHFEHLDLSVWRNFGRVHLEARPSAESLTCSPKAAWRHAQELYRVLGDILDFEARPNVISLDLFIDIVNLWVSESLLGRIKNMTGLRRWSDANLGGASVIYGKPKRISFYDKLLDTVENPSKRYIRAVWREAGWDGKSAMCRIDMRFKLDPEARARPLDLDALRDNILSRVVLTRRRRIPGRRGSARMEDRLWERLRALNFTPPWDARPSVLPGPSRSLNQDARQAASAAWWSLASLIVIEGVDPSVLDPWSRRLVEVVAKCPLLQSAAFQEKLVERARAHDLPVPVRPHRARRTSQFHPTGTLRLPALDSPGLIVGSVHGGALHVLGLDAQEHTPARRPSRMALAT